MPLKQYLAHTMCSINILKHTLKNHKSEMERMLKLDKHTQNWQQKQDKLTQNWQQKQKGEKIKTESLQREKRSSEGMWHMEIKDRTLLMGKSCSALNLRRWERMQYMWEKLSFYMIWEHKVLVIKMLQLSGKFASGELPFTDISYSIWIL